MAQLDQVDFKLFLEGNGVKDPGRACQQLHEHGVTTLTQFAELSVETLREWDINDYYCVVNLALPHAKQLLRDSSHDLVAIKQQQLLVRARMHYMYSQPGASGKAGHERKRTRTRMRIRDG